MALKLHIGIPESCSEGPAATIALPHQTDDDHGGDEELRMVGMMIMEAMRMVTRVRKSKNFPDSKICVEKTFQIKRVNRVNFWIRDKCP